MKIINYDDWYKKENYVLDGKEIIFPVTGISFLETEDILIALFDWIKWKKDMHKEDSRCNIWCYNKNDQSIKWKIKVPKNGRGIEHEEGYFSGLFYIEDENKIKVNFIKKGITTVYYLDTESGETVYYDAFIKDM